MLETHPKLQNIPVIANVDFGHTTPICTFPIGGGCEFICENGKIKKIKIIDLVLIDT